jgi:hypothetical protein
MWMVPLRLVVGKKRDSNHTLNFDEVRMPRLPSINVSLPRDVTWNGNCYRLRRTDAQSREPIVFRRSTARPGSDQRITAQLQKTLRRR